MHTAPQQDEMMMTPLHYAAGWGYEEMTEMLLGAGADPYIGNMVCNISCAFIMRTVISNFRFLEGELDSHRIGHQ
jgi:ankyrin repeat protein